MAAAGGISARTAATHTIRGNLGPGCLALPFAFAQCGWAVGAATLVLTVAQGTYCMQVLAGCERAAWRARCLAAAGGSVPDFEAGAAAAAVPRLSLGETAESCLGGCARRVVEGFVLVFQAGVCCVYISLVSENVAALPPWPLGRA